MASRTEQFSQRFGDIAADPGDGRTTRLRKSLLLGGVLVLLPVVLPWSLLYFYLGYPLAALIPGLYFVFSCFSVLFFCARATATSCASRNISLCSCCRLP